MIFGKMGGGGEGDNFIKNEIPVSIGGGGSYPIKDWFCHYGLGEGRISSSQIRSL